MTEFVIGEPLMNKPEAEAKAKSKAKKLKRETKTASCSVVGDPSIRAGAPLVFKGIRPGVDGLNYVIESVTHSFGKNKLTTNIDAELKV